jgi:hypothetical protein
MDAHARWNHIIANAEAARRVEPYASWGPHEWSIWATGMLSTLTGDEAREIAIQVLGFRRGSHEAQPSVLRTALIDAMVGLDVRERWIADAEIRAGTRDRR